MDSRLDRRVRVPAHGPLGRHPIRRALMVLPSLWLLSSPAQADVVASPAAIAFGDVAVNACVRRTFTVTANDPGDLVLSVQLTGDTASYTLNAPPGFTPPTPIPIAGWTFAVEYAPATLGAHAATSIALNVLIRLNVFVLMLIV